MKFGDRRLESVDVVKFFRDDDKWGWYDRGKGLSRIEKATRVIGVLNEPVWKGTELSRRTTLKICNAIVVPTVMYRSEMCILNKQQESAIQDTEVRVLKDV